MSAITEEVGRHSDHFCTAACEQICGDKLNRSKQIFSAYSFHIVLVNTSVNFKEYIILRLQLTAFKFITAIWTIAAAITFLSRRDTPSFGACKFLATTTCLRIQNNILHKTNWKLVSVPWQKLAQPNSQKETNFPGTHGQTRKSSMRTPAMWTIGWLVSHWISFVSKDRLFSSFHQEPEDGNSAHLTPCAHWNGR